MFQLRKVRVNPCFEGAVSTNNNIRSQAVGLPDMVVPIHPTTRRRSPESHNRIFSQWDVTVETLLDSLVI
jgi:hypothetical protein